MTSFLPELKAKLASLPVEVAKLSKERSTIIQITTSKPRIQKVQPYLRQRAEFTKYYSPKLVSIGPIHRPKDKEKSLQQGEDHSPKEKEQNLKQGAENNPKDNEENLKQGEEYKLMWASMYVEGMAGKLAEQLLSKICTEIETLKGLYTNDVIQGHGDAKLAWMFFVDGCAVLYFMDKVNVENPRALKIKVDQMIIVQHDLLLLENQLPFQVLKLLCNDDDAKLKSYVNNFFKMHHMMPEHEVKITGDQPPIHLLDLLRRAILLADDHEHPHPRQKNRSNQMFTHRNIEELKASGIRIKTRDSLKKFKCPIFSRNETRYKKASLTDISFDGGRLYLSKLMVDDFTVPTFLNMIAYEMCPDFENEYEISSYVSFLNSLIDHADDVKELRKAEVLHNSLGSDQEVANIFNTVSADLVFDIGGYGDVRMKIEEHYKNKWMTWMSEIYHRYFRSPWGIMALVATFLGAFLTAVSTWKALHSLKP